MSNEIKESVLTQKEIKNRSKALAKQYVLYCLLTDPRNKWTVKNSIETFIVLPKKIVEQYMDHAEPLKELVDMGYVLIQKQGGRIEGNSEYQVLKTWDIDVSNPVVQKEIMYLLENPSRKWNKTNQGIGFKINNTRFGDFDSNPYKNSDIEKAIQSFNSKQFGELQGSKSIPANIYKTFRNDLPIHVIDSFTYNGGRCSNVKIKDPLVRLLGIVIQKAVINDVKGAIKQRKEHLANPTDQYILPECLDPFGNISNVTKALLADISKYNSVVDNEDTTKSLIKLLGLDISAPMLIRFLDSVLHGKKVDQHPTYIALKKHYPNILNYIEKDIESYRCFKDDKTKVIEKSGIIHQISLKEESLIKKTSKHFKGLDRLTLQDQIIIPEISSNLIGVNEKLKQLVKDSLNEQNKRIEELSLNQGIEEVALDNLKPTKEDIVKSLKLNICQDHRYPNIKYYRKKVNGKNKTCSVDASIDFILWKFK